MIQKSVVPPLIIFCFVKSSVVLDRVFFHFEEFRVLRDYRRRVVAEIVDDIRLVEAAAALVCADVVAGVNRKSYVPLQY